MVEPVEQQTYDLAEASAHPAQTAAAGATSTTPATTFPTTLDTSPGNPVCVCLLRCCLKGHSTVEVENFFAWFSLQNFDRCKD